MIKKIILLLLVIILFSSCQIKIEESNPFAKEPKKLKKIKVGISMASMEEDVYKIMKKAISDYGKKHNVSLIWKNANNQLSQQEEDIQSLIDKKVDIIIMHAVNPSKKSTNMIKSIHKDKIPVIALDRLVTNANFDAYISADNFKAGQLQGRYLADQINKEGNIIILKGDKNTNTVESITKGNKNALKENKKINIIKEEFHSNYSKDLAKNTVREIIMKNNDFKGILANNDQLALGAIEILAEYNLKDKVVVVGFDASKEAAIAIAQEELDATIDKMAYSMGKQALMIAIFIARGEDWNWDRTIRNGQHQIKLVISPVTLISKYNIKELEKRWGKLPIK